MRERALLTRLMRRREQLSAEDKKLVDHALEAGIDIGTILSLILSLAGPMLKKLIEDLLKNRVTETAET